MEQGAVQGGRLRGEEPGQLRQELLDLEDGSSVADAATVQRLLELLGHSAKEIRRRAAGALKVAVCDQRHARSVAAGLSSEEPHRSWGAAFALGRTGHDSPEIVDAALRALGSPDGDVRWAAAELCCNLVRRGACPEDRLQSLAADAPPRQRKMALYCMRDLGREYVATYLAALDDDDAGVRFAGLAGLGRSRLVDDAALARMAVCLHSDTVPGVRRATAAIMARVMGTSTAALAALSECAANDPDPATARVAADLLVAAGAGSGGADDQRQE